MGRGLEQMGRWGFGERGGNKEGAPGGRDREHGGNGELGAAGRRGGARAPPLRAAGKVWALACARRG